MALTIEALKGLFKKLGGSDSGFAGVNTIPEAIDKVTSVASSGGGGSLPTPGTAGNVLTSTGSGWESAAPQGDEFVVTATCVPGLDTVDFSEVSATMSEIVSAFAANKRIVFRSQYPDTNPVMFFDVPLTLCGPVGGGSVYAFGESAISVSFGQGMLHISLHDNDGETAVTSVIYPVLPDASSAHDGNVLGVEDGAYALIDSKAPVEFEFDITVDTSGGSPVFTATARTGSTYANITAAMAEQPNVYMKAYLPDNEVLIAPFNRKRQTLVSASGLVPDYSGTTLTNWQAFGLNVEDSDTLVVFFNNLTLQ